MVNRSGDSPYGMTTEVIQRDLRDECPPWILSCYGPGKDAPEQLFGGYPREQSFEEIRLHYMQGAMSGNPQGAIAEIEGLYNNAQQQIQTALSNVNAAIQFVVDAANKHPNRLDVCRQGTPTGGTAGVFSKDKSAFGGTPNAFQSGAVSNNPFGAPTSTGSGFAQPSTLGQKPNPFSTPTFGQPSQPTSAFGQPATLSKTSAFGQGTSAFGQPSALSAKPSPFGTPVFGQPARTTSVFGQAPQPSGTFGPNTPAFGQPSQPTGGPAFGQPSRPVGAFGQPSTLGQKPNPFGAAPGPSPFAQQASSNVFGQPSQTASSGPFGQPATAAPAPATNPFGQPATTTSNPFGQPTTASPSPFGAPQSSAPSITPFGANAPSGFGPTAAPAVPFSQPAQPAQPGPSLFGKPSPSPFGGGVTSSNTFGTGNTTAAPAKSTAQTTGPYAPDATRQHPEPNSYSSKGPDGKLRMFKGKPVSYQALGSKTDKQFPVLRAFDGTMTRIWFPDGPPNYSIETEASDRTLYQDPKVKEQWNSFMQTETFADGLMPEVPPLREFCKWDF